MESFTTSRLTIGNKIFPSKIIIDDLGITLKIPGLLSGKEKIIPYSRVSSVAIDCPFVGYSTIIIETTGEGRISVHGFTKTEVNRIKELILSKLS